jgi:hypothetical protein
MGASRRMGLEPGCFSRMLAAARTRKRPREIKRLVVEWLDIMHAATARLDLAARTQPITLDSYLRYLRLT